MPKNKKKGKQQHEDEEFDDMLAELQAADLATASSASSTLAISSLSSTPSSLSGVGADARPSMTPLPSPAAAHVAAWSVSEEAIVDACISGNIFQLRRWGSQGIRIRTAKPLCGAVLNGASVDVLSYMVKELGADVNQRDENGWKALIVAGFAGHHDTVRYLAVELGADVNSPDKMGRTPLSRAASHGHLDVVRLLLALRANINQSDNEGITPLMIASGQKQHDVVKWLAKAGAGTQAHYCNDPRNTAAFASKAAGASIEQTAYLEAKTHCSSPSCSGAGVMKCMGCKQARYCGEACQLAHWKAHKADCRQRSVELAAGNVNYSQA
jgi:hypothetical protein